MNKISNILKNLNIKTGHPFFLYRIAKSKQFLEERKKRLILKDLEGFVNEWENEKKTKQKHSITCLN